MMMMIIDDDDDDDGYHDDDDDNDDDDNGPCPDGSGLKPVDDPINPWPGDGHPGN